MGFQGTGIAIEIMMDADDIKVHDRRTYGYLELVCGDQLFSRAFAALQAELPNGEMSDLEAAYFQSIRVRRPTPPEASTPRSIPVIELAGMAAAAIFSGLVYVAGVIKLFEWVSGLIG